MLPLEGHGIARKRYSDEDCLKILRQVEVELTGGSDVPTACRSAGISDAFTPGGAERRMVLHHQAGPDSHQSMATPAQPYPAAPRSRHATASARNNRSEPPNHWY